jgi:hypothetical protein
MAGKTRKVTLGVADEPFDEGGHIIYVYRDDAERKKTMARFFRQGLVENDRLLYMVDDISSAEMVKELQELGVDTDARINDFDLYPGHYACCPDAYFSAEFMLGMVARYYQSALDQGYAGARGIGEMSWALVENRARLEDLLVYEAKLNRVLENHPLTTVCQYDASRFDPAVIMDMLTIHPLMIVRGQLVKNPGFMEPECFLEKYRSQDNKAHA